MSATPRQDEDRQIADARLALGDDASGLSDEDVRRTLTGARTIARGLIDAFLNRRRAGDRLESRP